MSDKYGLPKRQDRVDAHGFMISSGSSTTTRYSYGEDLSCYMGKLQKVCMEELVYRTLPYEATDFDEHSAQILGAMILFSKEFEALLKQVLLLEEDIDKFMDVTAKMRRYRVADAPFRLPTRLRLSKGSSSSGMSEEAHAAREKRAFKMYMKLINDDSDTDSRHGTGGQGASARKGSCYGREGGGREGAEESDSLGAEFAAEYAETIMSQILSVPEYSAKNLGLRDGVARSREEYEEREEAEELDRLCRYSREHGSSSSRTKTYGGEDGFGYEDDDDSDWSKAKRGKRHRKELKKMEKRKSKHSTKSKNYGEERGISSLTRTRNYGDDENKLSLIRKRNYGDDINDLSLTRTRNYGDDRNDLMLTRTKNMERDMGNLSLTRTRGYDYEDDEDEEEDNLYNQIVPHRSSRRY